MATVLITGGCGFIGSHLARRCVELGHDVRVLDDLATGHERNLDPVKGQLSLIRGSVADADAVARAVAGAEVVFHQAAIPSVPRSVQDPVGTHRVNVDGALTVLDQARLAKVRRVVLASSSSVYGDSPVSPKHEGLPISPKSPYAAQKATLEVYARLYAELYGLDTACLRYFNVFGPGQDPKSQYAAAIPAFVTAALSGSAPTIFGDGEQTRDFTFVDDVVRANLLAAFCERPVGGEAMNVACGERISVNAVIALIGELLGRPVAATYLPERPGDIKHSLADVRKAGNLIGFQPQVTFREGLRRAIASYASS